MAGNGHRSPAGGREPRVYSTGPVRALGHAFEVETTDEALAAYLDSLFAAMVGAGQGRRTAMPEVQRYAVVEHPGAAGSEPTWQLTVDGREIVRTSDASQVLAMLLWDVNRSAVERTRDLLLLHAAAAERGGAAVILPGAMEAGKTTMVAGLLRAGLAYLTDEVTAIDPATLTIVPYPKPLSVDPGSWEVLADLEPHVPDGARPFLPHQWQVVPAALRADAVARTARPRLVVLPRYEAGAPTRLTALSRADALVAVSGCVFSFERQPERALRTLAATLARCDAYELVSSDLDDGVRVVIDLLEHVSGAVAGDDAEPVAASSAQDEARATEVSRRRDSGELPHPPGPGGPLMGRPISPDDVTLDFAPCRHGGVTGVELDGEMVLYAGEGTMHKLDPIATVLWNCFDEAVTLGELVEDLASIFDGATPERIRDDVLTCVRELGRLGLLANVSPGGDPEAPAAGRDTGP